MFEKFTAAARQVVIRSQAEARERQAGEIRTEHLLAALLRVSDNLSTTVLAAFAIERDAVLAQIAALPVGEGSDVKFLPYEPAAQRSLELAMHEAQGLEHDGIGCVHLLLGLIRSEDGAASRILSGGGMQLEPARMVVRELVAAARPA